MTTRGAPQGLDYLSLLGSLAVLLAGCGGGEEQPRAAAMEAGTMKASTVKASTVKASTVKVTGAPAEAFVERAAEVGLGFHHFNGMSGRYHMAEISGSGGAFLDYDGDGDLDLYLLQGTLLPPAASLAEATVAPRHPPPLTDRLYRNELTPGDPGSLRFTDVTAEAGLEAELYGMGVAVGDYDGDGWPDLYVTNFGPNQLLRNQGDGTFRDVTAEAGVQDERWSVPAVFFDHDGDGRLDLFVGNYLELAAGEVPICRDTRGAQDYCGPDNYPPQGDRLWRNLGPGEEGRVRFEDVTHAAGLRGGFGPALGVVAADLTGDGRLDLYVTNDGRPNNLWVARGDGSYEDRALAAGCAVNAAGQAEASMGVDAADLDGDGDLDLFMTHLISETNTYYLNEGGGLFRDATSAAGLGAPSRRYTSFGTGALDFDQDGWLDLFVANGAVKTIEALAHRGDPFPLHHPNQLFRNLGAGRFEEVPASEAGAVFELSEVSRGALFGDVDDDGDTDVAVVNNNGPLRLLINRAGDGRRWLGLRLLEGEPGRDAPGAVAELRRADGRRLLRRVRLDGSFASAGDPRLLFGLGDDPRHEEVRVTWGDGAVEAWPALEPDRYHVLRRGKGRKVER